MDLLRIVLMIIYLIVGVVISIGYIKALQKMRNEMIEEIFRTHKDYIDKLIKANEYSTEKTKEISADYKKSCDEQLEAQRLKFLETYNKFVGSFNEFIENLKKEVYAEDEKDAESIAIHIVYDDVHSSDSDTADGPDPEN